MATIAGQLTHLNATKSLIRDAIIDKGVAVPESTPFRQYAGKIAAIPQSGGPSVGGWGRPSERPALPFDEETGPDEGTIYMLFGVQPGAMNDMAIQFTGGQGFIHWGDGYTEGFSSNMRERTFNYDTLDIAPDSDGVKWVWIRIAFDKEYPPSVMIHNLKPSARPSGSVYYIPQVYEIYMNSPTITSWSWSTSAYTRYGLLEYFRWYGKCNLASLANFGAYTLRLKDCIFDDSSSAASFSSFLYYSGICGRLKASTASATNISSMLRFATNFNAKYEPDTNKVMSMGTVMQNANAYAYPLVLDAASLTADIGAVSFSNMYALPSLRLLNMPTAVSSLSVTNSAMPAAALASLFGDLCDRTGLASGSITITGAAGADALTTEQRAIATNKNWTIVG